MTKKRSRNRPSIPADLKERRQIVLIRAKTSPAKLATAIQKKRGLSDYPTRQAVSAVIHGTARSEPLARFVANELSELGIDDDFETLFPEYADEAGSVL